MRPFHRARRLLAGLLICQAGASMATESKPATVCPSPERPAVLSHWHAEMQAVGQGEVAAPQSVRIHVPVACAGSELQLTIEWENSADDLDVDLLDPAGRLAARADRLNPLEGDSREQIRLEIPHPGHYVVAVRNYAATPITYRGKATLTCQRAEGCAPLPDQAPQRPRRPIGAHQVIAGLGAATNTAAH